MKNLRYSTFCSKCLAKDQNWWVVRQELCTYLLEAFQESLECSGWLQEWHLVVCSMLGGRVYLQMKLKKTFSISVCTRVRSYKNEQELRMNKSEIKLLLILLIWEIWTFNYSPKAFTFMRSVSIYYLSDMNPILYFCCLLVCLWFH